MFGFLRSFFSDQYPTGIYIYFVYINCIFIGNPVLPARVAEIFKRVTEALERKGQLMEQRTLRF